LGVSALVSGRVILRDHSIEVSAELTDVQNNTELWGNRYAGKDAEIISLQQQIARDVAKTLRPTLSGEEKEQVSKLGTQNREAYDLYLQGRYSWNKRTRSDIEMAISYFNQAIAKDPSYALAYSGLADAYSVLWNYGSNPMESYPKSNAAARTALEIDPSLAHPHAILGSNKMQYDWDFAGGEAEYKKALELDPSDATAHQWYATDLAWLGGRTNEAIDEVNRAHQLDPLSPIISFEQGFVYLTIRQFDKAINICEQLTIGNPKFALAHHCLAQAYWGKGIYEKVVEEYKVYGQLSGDRNDLEFASALEQGFHSSGWKGALAKAIEIRQAQRRVSYSSAYAIAALYAGLGDKDAAFNWLYTAYRERDALLEGLNTDFLLDPLRSDRRFIDLVHKVGLPQ